MARRFILIGFILWVARPFSSQDKQDYPTPSSKSRANFLKTLIRLKNAILSQKSQKHLILTKRQKMPELPSLLTS
jgi:hypothetical protein|tara:strand:- start:56 stop:280 length:225 start_codon:yes stop_codon:yes gene_type:complete